MMKFALDYPQSTISADFAGDNPQIPDNSGQQAILSQAALGYLRADISGCRQFHQSSSSLPYIRKAYPALQMVRIDKNMVGLEIGLASAALTFIIGLLAGIVLKRTMKLALAIVALVVVLALAGYINLSFTENIQVIIYRAYSQAPDIENQAKNAIRILPIASATFIGGLGLGLWKG